MALQAFIDDSYKDNGVYVLAGAVATTQNWGLFSEEWERVLKGWGVVSAKNKNLHYKHVLMNQENRKSRIPIFLNTIEKYISGYVVSELNVVDLKNAKNRIVVPGRSVDWQEYDVFFMAFRALMDTFHIHRQEMTEAFGSDSIDFYFDEQSQKNRILAMWNNYISNRPESIRKYYGNTPRFESDDQFLQLQAADLLAGWARECYETGNQQDYLNLSMEGFNRIGQHKILRFSIDHTEDQLVKNLVKVVRSHVDSSVLIYDSGPRLIIN